MRSITNIVIGAIAGLLAGSFANSGSTPIPKLDTPGHDESWQVHARNSLRRPISAAMTSAPTSGKTAISIDWEDERISLPQEFLDRIDIAGFTSETQSPWAADSEAFVISEELQELLQLEKDQIEAVRSILVDARETYMSAQWSRPTTIRRWGDAVVIELDPAPAELGRSIRESLVPVMGERRASFLLEKVAATLDWEFGGFGRTRRVIEVSVLPDDTISLRESLRRANLDDPDHFAMERPRVDQQFELRTRQYRVDHLPTQIAALVRIEQTDGRE